MTSFKSYFRSHLKSNGNILLYLTVIALVLTLVIGISSGTGAYWDSKLEAPVTTYHSTIDVPVVFLYLLVYIAPVLEFSFFKKRINLNCAYAMPISRRALGLVHYLTGAITVLIPYTLSYFLNFILILTRGVQYYNLAPMIAHYFLCLLLGLAIYSMMVFAFNEANSTGDGILFMILWSFVMLFATLAMGRHIRMSYSHIFPFPWLLISQLTTSYQHLIEMTVPVYSGGRGFLQTPHCIFGIVIWSLLGIASGIRFFLSFGKRRMEKTEEISDSFFGYRVLIPYFAVTGIIALPSFSIWVIFEILTLIGYTIYRRGFHYKLSDIIVLLSLLVFLIFI